MSSELNGAVGEVFVNGIFLEARSNSRNERLIFWGNIAAKNANTRLGDTLLYAELLEAGGTSVPAEELSEVETRLRTQAEYELNQTEAIANLLGINRGGVGYPNPEQD